MYFQRSLGPVGLLFTAVGGMLGSSWLFGPYYVAQAAGPAAILAWILGGLSMMVIAMTFAELTCMFPVSGTNARFIYFSHGVFASFVFGWIMWLGYAAVAPVETLAILQYAAGKYPWLMTHTEGISVLTLKGYAVASGILLFMCAFNFLSIKWLVRYNNLLVWFKLLVPLLVSVALLSVSFHPENFYATPGGLSPYGLEGLAKAISVSGVIFAYAGYMPAIALAGEVKHPGRVVPLVLIGSIGLCMILYILIQVAFIGAHEPANLSGGWDALHFHRDGTPLVGTLQQLNLYSLSDIVFLAAVLSPAGTAVIFIATTARVSFAMSQNGYFPQALMYLSEKGVPTLAVLANFIAGMILFVPHPGWQSMVSFLVAAFVVCYCIAPISLVALRSQMPKHRRPFTLPFYKVWSGIAFFLGNLIIYWTGWTTYYRLSIAIGVGIVLLLGVRRCNPVIVAKQPLEWQHGLWVVAYFIAMGVLTYMGDSDTGLGAAPPWVDVLCIMLLTVVILYWSWAARLPADIAQARVAKALQQHGVTHVQS
jgi:amino acid transporter